MGLFGNIKVMSHAEKVQYAYDTYRDEYAVALFPNGPEEAGKIILEIAKICGVDPAACGKEKYEALLNMYTETVAGSIVQRSAKESAISTIYRKYGKMAKGHEDDVYDWSMNYLKARKKETNQTEPSESSNNTDVTETDASGPEDISVASENTNDAEESESLLGADVKSTDEVSDEEEKLTAFDVFEAYDTGTENEDLSLDEAIAAVTGENLTKETVAPEKGDKTVEKQIREAFRKAVKKFDLKVDKDEPALLILEESRKDVVKKVLKDYGDTAEKAITTVYYAALYATATYEKDDNAFTDADKGIYSYMKKHLHVDMNRIAEEARAKVHDKKGKTLKPIQFFLEKAGLADVWDALDISARKKAMKYAFLLGVQTVISK